MQKLNQISKKDAISKFGSYFVIAYEKNRYGYIVKECLGNADGGLFKLDYTYKSKEEALSYMIVKIKEEAEDTIKYYDGISTSLRAKWLLFRHKKGWIKGQRADAISNNLSKLEKAKENFKVINVDDCFKPLPETMYIPETYFEIGEECYHFIHSKTMQHENKLNTFKVSGINFEVDQNSVIHMEFSFVDSNNNSIHGQIDHHKLMAFNGDYFILNYSNCYLFFNKDKCKSFAKEKLEEEIKSLQAIIKDFD